MKRELISCVLAASMVMGLGACSSEPTETEAPETTAAETTEAAAESTTEATAEETTEETEPEVELANITTGLFSADYDDTVWTYNENSLSDSTYNAAVWFLIPGATEEDNPVVTVKINVRDENVNYFRDDIYGYGLSEYDYAVEGAYDRQDIASIECLVVEESDTKLHYLGRNEDGHVTLYIDIEGDTGNDEIAALLDNLTVFAPQEGNVDYPWYWEGEPMNFGDLSGTVGDYTINTHQLVMDESFVSHVTFDNRVAVSGDKLYILTRGIINEYTIADGALTYSATYDLGDDSYKEMQVTSDGRIFISGFTCPLIEWADGEIVNSYTGSNYDDVQYVTMHPSGAWGISWFVSNECKKITLNDDGTVSPEDVVFAEADIISTIVVTENYIFVCGTPSEEDNNSHTIFVYDLDCNYVMSLQADDNGWGLGSVTYVGENANGFFAMDGNLRKVCFWNADGSYIGNIEDDVLFGTYYPWFCGGCLAPDGTTYLVLTEERPDHSADEVIVYTLGGF